MKNIFKKTLAAVFAVSFMFILVGCWDYREIDKLAIIAGAAIDKADGKYYVTVEIATPISGKEPKIASKLITMKGETVFDAVRNIIKISGKKAYWSHVKVFIVSQEVAREGIIQAIDWINRDAEPRMSTNILISREKTAKELLEQPAITYDVISFEMYDMLTSQDSLSKAPRVASYEFITALAGQGRSGVLPAIGIAENAGKRSAELCGMAIFKEDRLLGFLDGEDTKYFLFAADKARGGLLVEKADQDSPYKNTSLEVFPDLTKSRIKPVYSNGKLSMDLDVYVTADIGEIGRSGGKINETTSEAMGKDFEESLKINIERVIKKVQTDYGSDILGLGSIVRNDMPQLWKTVEGDWENIYRDLDVNVKTHITLENSSLLIKQIKKGD